MQLPSATAMAAEQIDMNNMGSGWHSRMTEDDRDKVVDHIYGKVRSSM